MAIYYLYAQDSDFVSNLAVFMFIIHLLHVHLGIFTLSKNITCIILCQVLGSFSYYSVSPCS